MNQTPLDIVQTFHRAWTSNDIDGALALLADDFVCSAPGQDFTGPEAYRPFIASFAPQLTGVPEIATFTTGDQVCLLYYPQTEQTRTAACAELLTVRDGTISASVLIFDRLSYGPPQG